MPPTTAARTPDTPSCSAGMYARAGARNVTTTEKTGSSTRRRTAATTQPTTSPNTMPPSATMMNAVPASTSENVPVAAAVTAKRYATSAVASLTRDSPSRIVTARRGAPSRWKIEGRRDRVGRGNDRAEGGRGRQSEAGDERVGDERDDGRRRQDEPHREKRDRPQVRLEVADRREVAGAEEDRRQEQEEHELGLELDPGHAGDEPGREPTEDGEERV